MNNLTDLVTFGQSYWLDNLNREKINNGEIKRRVSEEGLRGITSNPSIFNKAFSSGTAYDKQIESLARDGKTTREIYDALTVKDVQDACDILKTVYDVSNGIDGFVSLEVSPYLARDTLSTMAEARRLYTAVNRENCYIKIPGTKEGVAAIEEMLFEGININITLLFSIDNYEEVAFAYLRALRRRLSDGKPVSNIVSVASFFLSRIDVLCDQLIKQHITQTESSVENAQASNLLGKTGVASAKIAYQHYKQIFSGPDWQELAERGANVQRLLWASTSTKNKNYSDVLYVDTLIGEDTVNTLTEETITAFADHGILKKDSIEEDLAQASQVFSQLEELGIKIDLITQQLENEGIHKFLEAYDELMDTLDKKRAQYA